MKLIFKAHWCNYTIHPIKHCLLLLSKSLHPSDILIKEATATKKNNNNKFGSITTKLKHQY